MTATLEFLNKNLYRAYPLRSGSSLRTLEGVRLPTELITSTSVTVTYAMRDVYVSRIFCKGNYLNVVIHDNLTDTALGSFAGNITSNYQQLTFTPFIANVSGAMTAGTIEAIQKFTGSWALDVNAGRLEDSTVFCFTPPAVTKFVLDDKIVTGNVKLVGHNISIDTTGTLTLNVIDKEDLLSHNDFSSTFGNCATPVITHINTVPADSSGNIDIYGIAPVQISISNGTVVITPGTLTLTELCQAKNKRLAPTNGSDDYYTNILTTDTPEWKTW